MVPAIELEHVTKCFGPKVALEDLSLRISPGELVAFLGPNGAGKTTTIKLIAGLLRPTAGRIAVLGHDVVSDGQRARRCLAYVPDEPYLYEKLTGREFLELVTELYRMDSAVACRRMEELIDVFDMRSYIDNLTETYSHGMKQRVVFAAALVRDPEVLLLDEPLVGLDPPSARLVKELLRERVRRGAAVLMSTHTLSVAEELADRIAILHQGKLLRCTTLAELRQELGTDGRLEELFLRLVERNGALDSAPTNGARVPPEEETCPKVS
jgi:ABC-2 type transport system ATP-binding protein